MYGCWRCMDESCKWPWWSWLVLLAVLIIIAYLMQPRPKTKAPRYKVVEESLSGHCCFEYTIVDTVRPKTAVGVDGGFEPLCECWSREEADLICNALNAFERGRA